MHNQQQNEKCSENPHCRAGDGPDPVLAAGGITGVRRCHQAARGPVVPRNIQAKGDSRPNGSASRSHQAGLGRNDEAGLGRNSSWRGHGGCHKRTSENDCCVVLNNTCGSSSLFLELSYSIHFSHGEDFECAAILKGCKQISELPSKNV